MPTNSERQYHLVAVNDRTSYSERVTAKPATHQECMTMKARFNLHCDVRLVLEAAPAA